MIFLLLLLFYIEVFEKSQITRPVSLYIFSFVNDCCEMHLNLSSSMMSIKEMKRTVVWGSMMGLQWSLRHSPGWLDTSACGVRWYFITSCKRGKSSEELRGSRHSDVCVWSAQNTYWELIASANGWWSAPATGTTQNQNKSIRFKSKRVS